MEMRNFAVINPFTINWRLAAPRDFETLEYFLTPDLSLVLRNIIGRQDDSPKLLPFYIGTFFGQERAGAEPMTKKKFMTEILPQRSQERINEAFRNEEIPCFFSLEEARELGAMFERGAFTCRNVEIHKQGRQVGLLEISSEDYRLVMKELGQMRAVGLMDLEKVAEPFQAIYEETDKAAYRRVRAEAQEQEAKRKGVSKRQLKIGGMIGLGCLTVSAALAALGRRLFYRPSWLTYVGGALCMVASIVVGIFGKRFAEETIEHYRKGLIVSYA